MHYEYHMWLDQVETLLRYEHGLHKGDLMNSPNFEDMFESGYNPREAVTTILETNGFRFVTKDKDNG